MRHLPLTEYPEHVARLETFAFKPIIEDLTLQDHQSIIWLDSGDELRAPLHTIMDQLRRNGYWFAQQPSTIDQQTRAQTYALLHVDPLKFINKPFCAGNMHGFVRNTKAYENVLKPTITCALNEHCIAPKAPPSKSPVNLQVKTHNFDQSVYSIMLYEHGYQNFIHCHCSSHYLAIYSYRLYSHWFLLLDCAELLSQ